MSSQETSHDIDRAASDWTARIDRAPLTLAEEHEFQAWLAHDPRSRGALMRAQAIAMMSESARALGPDFDPRAFAEPRPPVLVSRRRAFAWGGGAVAAAAVAGGVLGIAMPAWGAISTRRGEIRLVPLEDGSTVMLNTETSIKIAYDASERRVRLLTGEAYFTVAPDPRRPFVVEVGGRRLRATRAAFRVRKLGDAPVDVLVEMGRIDLPAAALQPALSLPAYTQLTLAAADGSHNGTETPQPVAPALVTRALAWREGKLAFEGETLGEVAAAFARYSDTRILVADPALAREPVTGLFDAHDPAGFSTAIASVFDAHARRDGNAIVLTRAPAAS